MRNIFLAFIPIFVAVDAIEVLPIYISITSGIDRRDRRKILIQSMLAAGGAILFYLAILDLIQAEKKRRRPGSDLGIVPL